MTAALENRIAIDRKLKEAKKERDTYYELQKKYHREIGEDVRTDAWVIEPARKLATFREETEKMEEELQRKLGFLARGHNFF